jgi:hypothetical protein
MPLSLKRHASPRRASDVATEVVGEIADVLWIAVHGAVRLEIMSYSEAAGGPARYRLLTPFLTTTKRPFAAGTQQETGQRGTT